MIMSIVEILSVNVRKDIIVKIVYCGTNIYIQCILGPHGELNITSLQILRSA